MERTVKVPPYAVLEELNLPAGGSALLIIDMQNDFVQEEGKLFVADAPATVQTIKDLRERARAARLPVLYTQDTHREGDPEWELWGEHARRGSWGWQIVPDLAPAPDEIVIEKLRYDAFYATPLDHQLRLLGVSRLVICGTVANICVHYTAASAALRWFEVVIPVDGISALDPFDRESALRQSAFLFAAKLVRAAGLRFSPLRGDR